MLEINNTRRFCYRKEEFDTPDSYADSQKKITRESIFTALIVKLKKESFNDITITQLTKVAGVSRMAFYRNYSTKEDIIIKYLDELFNEFINEIKCSKINTRYDFALLYFSFFMNRNEIIEVLVHSELSYILFDRFSFYMSKFFIITPYSFLFKLEYNDYLAHYASAGLLSILLAWIKNTKRESIEDMAKLIAEFPH
jgi:AcrR family transcriptional regulator